MINCHRSRILCLFNFIFIHMGMCVWTHACGSIRHGDRVTGNCKHPNVDAGKFCLLREKSVLLKLGHVFSSQDIRAQNYQLYFSTCVGQNYLFYVRHENSASIVGISSQWYLTSRGQYFQERPRINLQWTLRALDRLTHSRILPPLMPAL